MCEFVLVVICWMTKVYMNPPGSVWFLQTSPSGHWTPSAPGNEMRPIGSPGNTTCDYACAFFHTLLFMLHCTFSLNKLLLFPTYLWLGIKCMWYPEWVRCISPIITVIWSPPRSELPHPSPCNHSQLHFPPNSLFKQLGTLCRSHLAQSSGCEMEDTLKAGSGRSHLYRQWD